MLPGLGNGPNLPVGIHVATLDEITAQLGIGERRRSLCETLRAILQRARECGFRKVVLFGSFVSTKQIPGDIDLFWVLVPGLNTDDLSAGCRELLDATTSKTRFGCDVFWCYDEPEAITRMVGLWDIDRSGNKRGLVMVDVLGN